MSGTDFLVFSGNHTGENREFVQNIEYINGADSSEYIFIAHGDTSLDLKGGYDHIIFGNYKSTSNITAVNAELIVSGSIYQNSEIHNENVYFKGDYATISLGGGNDLVTIGSANGAVNLIAFYVEEIISDGSGNSDIVSYGSPFTDGVVNLLGTAEAFSSLGYYDAVSLGDFVNSGTIYNTETVSGGSESDTLSVQIANNPNTATIDLESGVDRLTVMPNGDSTISTSNVEVIVGSSEAENIFLNNTSFVPTLDLSSGADSLQTNTQMSAIAVNVESIYGRNLNDTVTVGATSIFGNILTIDFSGGNDTVSISQQSLGTTITLVNVETILGSSYADTIFVRQDVDAGGRHVSVDLGNFYDAPADTLTISSLPGEEYRVTISNVETFIGGGGNEIVTVNTPLFPQTRLNALSGNGDQLYLANTGNDVDVYNFESVMGGSHLDIVRILVANAVDTASVDLGAERDRLEIIANGSTTLTVSNVESIIGSSEAEHIFVSQTPINGTRSVNIDLIGHNDGIKDQVTTTSVAGEEYYITLSNVEVLAGGSGRDVVTLMNGLSVGDIMNGGSGSGDTIQLFNSTNSGSIFNFETVFGGNQADHVWVKVADAPGYATVDLGQGIDTLEIVTNGSTSISLVNVESIVGSLDQDYIFVYPSYSGVTISGGTGNDSMVIVGNVLSDRLIFGTGDGLDVVTGFVVGTDHIQLSATDQAGASVITVGGVDTRLVLASGEYVQLLGVTGVTSVSQLM